MTEYVIPHNLVEATGILKARKGDCLIVAGGTDLAVKLAGENVVGRVIIDVSQVAEMKKIELSNNILKLGAAVTFDEICRSPLIPHSLNSIREAAAEVGSPQIRNIATVGGNLGTSSPGGDINVALLGLIQQLFWLPPEKKNGSY